MKDEHIKTEPNSKYIGQQEIDVKKLDDVFDSFCKESDHVMLKIDTQGFEKQVLQGAEGILDKVSLIQLEMSLVALYETETLYLDIIEHLDKQGFKLIAFENGFSNKDTGILLQVDGVFSNKRITLN